MLNILVVKLTKEYGQISWKESILYGYPDLYKSEKLNKIDKLVNFEFLKCKHIPDDNFKASSFSF